MISKRRGRPNGLDGAIDRLSISAKPEAGETLVQDHFGETLSEPRGDSCSHADVYTGLQGVIAMLAALHHRDGTGEGQHVDISMAATMAVGE